MLDEVNDVFGGEEPVVHTAQGQISEIDRAHPGHYVLEQTLSARPAQVGVDQRTEQHRQRPQRGAWGEGGDDVDAGTGSRQVEGEPMNDVGTLLHVWADGDEMTRIAGDLLRDSFDLGGVLPADEDDAPVSRGGRGSGSGGHAATLVDNCSH
ncbi:hypothetical protein IFT88_16665 [Frigoribacterium sp. CFBP 8751]|nr:hypothetical protein [Frigoribacterium sp. CFBP 8751]